MLRYPAAALLLCTLLLAGCSTAKPAWQELPPAPEARTEVVGAALSGRVAVVGGLTADGRASARVDLYDPRRERWLRLPDLPEGLHHAMAASRAGRLYVVGGYRVRAGEWEASDRAWVLFDRRWRALPRLPQPRAAGGAAIVRNRIYVVGGTTARAPGSLAEGSLLLDLRTLRWQGFGGLSRPREHLGVTALGGRVYAIGGRTAGLETNTAAADAYDPLSRRWSRLPDPPTRRGGNGATVAGRLAVAVGGEGPDGTIRPVDAFDPQSGSWRSLPRSPRPRHGVAVVGIGRTLYQGLGGPRPGLTVSATLQSLRVPTPR
jgi:non-specific serine/threonine protein kinase